MSLEVVTLVGAALSLLLAAVYRYLKAPYDFFDGRGLAGPRPSLLFGTWWGLWNKVQGEEDLRRAKQFGTVYGTFDGRTPNLVVAEPALIRSVLQDKAAHFRSRRAFSVRDKFLHQGLLAIEARAPKGAADAGKLLTKDSIKKVVPRILQCTSELTQQVKNAAEATEGKVVINSVVADFLANVLTVAVFGQDATSGDKAIDVKQFSTFLNQTFLNDNPDSPLAAIPFIYPSLAPLDKFVLRSKAAKYFTSLLLTKVQERTRTDKPAEDRQPDLIELLLETQEAVKKESDDESKAEEKALQVKEFVYVQCLAVLLNTSLTTRAVTSLAISLLASKPEIQERLHSELYEQLENSVSVPNAAAESCVAKDITSQEGEFELVQNSEFLDMFLAELLRLYPVEFRLERECCETLELDKIKIETGTIVSVPVYALHRQYQLYPEPEAFNPDRFSRENKEKRDPFAYLPYGQAGDSAANISTQWSLLVAKLAIAALIKNFRFLPGDDTKQIPPPFEGGITGVPRLQRMTINVENRK